MGNDRRGIRLHVLLPRKDSPAMEFGYRCFFGGPVSGPST